MPETRKLLSRFDFFGFATLSLCIGALQLLLDRGGINDWFNSTEIVIEAMVAAVALYYFVVHSFTHPHPFLSPALFADRNFVMANIFHLSHRRGAVRHAGADPADAAERDALPGHRQRPCDRTPRRRTMLGMMVVGRLIGRFDARLIMATGLGLTAFSLWQMTHFNLLMDEDLIVISGIIQGFGVGLVYVPLSTVAFGTLPAALRNEGTAFFNLQRNLGSAIGISAVVTLLTQNTQIMHATLAEHITPYNLDNPAYLSSHIDPNSPAGLAALNHLITNQAAMVAYLNDYKLMLVLTLAVIPLLVFLRPPAQSQGKKEMAVME
jgi:hypothetical protein